MLSWFANFGLTDESENGMRGRSEMRITYERQFSGRLVPRTGFDEYGAQFYGSSKWNTYYPVRGSNMMTGEHGLVGETSTNIWSSASLSTHCHGTSGSVWCVLAEEKQEKQEKCTHQRLV